MMNLTRLSAWLLAAVMTLGLAACDAEVKVDTNEGDTAAVVDGDTPGDTPVTGGGFGDTPGTVDTGAGARPGGGTTNGGSQTGGSQTGGSQTGGSQAGGSQTGDAPTTGSSSRNIRVSSPRAGDLINARTFTLSGECRTFENTGAYRLSGSKGELLADGFFTATGEMGTFSPYTTTVELKRDYTGDATLEVFQNSAKDGTEIDKVRIPLKVRVTTAAKTSEVTVYFTNAQKNPGAVDCSRVFGTTRRIAATSAVARAALEELLRGPTAGEQGASYGTEIPAGTRLRNITINNGLATADFSRELNNGAGSCSVTAARAQIERTLRQFPTVRQVVIAVEGNSTAVLQP